MPRKNQPGCPCGCTGACVCSLACGGLRVPRGDLELTIDPPLLLNKGAVSSTVLEWNGNATGFLAGWTRCMCWGTGDQFNRCPGGGASGFLNQYFAVGCGAPLALTYGISTICGPDGDVPPSTLTNPVSFRQDPFEVVWQQVVGAGTFHPQTYTFTLTGAPGSPSPAGEPCPRICVTACGGLPVFGATVTAWMAGGTVAVARCTTDATGCCKLPACGTYLTTVTVGGVTVDSARRNLWGNVAIPIPSTGLVCCGKYLIPQRLHLTDGEGTLDFWFDPNAFVPTWYGGHSVQRASSTVTTPDNTCLVQAPTAGPVRVCYAMICRAGATPGFSVQRQWSWVFHRGDADPVWYQDPTGFLPGQLCITAPPGICGSPLTDVAAFDADPTSTAPFLLAGTPGPLPSNATADPVGGGIVISA